MRHFTSQLITMAFVLAATAPAWADGPQCVNDKSGKKGASNLDINRSLIQATDPLTQAFAYSNFEASQKAGYVVACELQDRFKTLQKASKDIVKVAKTQSPVKAIRRECIEASLQREVGNQGYSCLKDKPVKFENAGKSAPCLNSSTVDFIQYSLNQALSCMSSGRAPIDPRFILKKINNETAFNFYVAYNGGVGMGQLTSNPVKEIAGWKEDGQFIEGNGRHVLETLMKSTNPACKPFKEIMKDDLVNPPPRPGSARNYCTWVSPGKGVARNLIYSLGYYAHIRDQIVKPALAARSGKLAANQDVLNYLTLVAYGPQGPAEAKSLIRRLRLSNNTPPGEAVSKIIQNNAYVRQTEAKMNELLDEYKPGAPHTPADKKGDSCLM
ncbi:hypothetical protein EZJ49_11415 [Bdellovibrio bacteriovorus]|uniref:hypothetical protein n=1 Tax=Bdellovibrio bacteriovorus TaxID=959 RepID=UPI0021D0386C|nr:hypothetical protein [Bdellovibrio bacteriovorus]UXR63680.1 hypothetical protein EZJ49_11415 [Bdellovibrio bacteriovorus]